MKKNLLLIVLVFTCIAVNVNAQWTQSGLSPRQVNSLILNGTDLYAGCDSFVYISSNSGGAWAPASTGLPSMQGALSLVDAGAAVFALSNDPASGVYFTTNSGGNWSSTGPNGPLAMYGNRIVLRGSTLYGMGFSGVTHASIGFPSWSAYNTGLPHTCNLGFGGSGDGLFIYIDDGGSCTPAAVGAYRRTSASSAWTLSTGLPAGAWYPTPWTTVSNATKIFAGGQGVVYVTTDTGATWSSITTGSFDVISALAISGSTLIAGHLGAGIYVSVDTGNTWTSANTGLGFPDMDIRSLVIKGGDVFAGTAVSGVWKRSLANIVTSVKEAQADYFFKVYPNPANDKFTLSLQSSSDEKIKITITNVLGEIVYSSKQEHLTGEFSKEISLGDAGSGIYMVQVNLNDRVITKKIIIGN